MGYICVLFSYIITIYVDIPHSPSQLKYLTNTPPPILLITIFIIFPFSITGFFTNQHLGKCQMKTLISFSLHTKSIMENPQQSQHTVVISLKLVEMKMQRHNFTFSEPFPITTGMDTHQCMTQAQLLVRLKLDICNI